MGDLSGFLNRDNLEIAQSRCRREAARGTARAHRGRHDLRQDRQGRVRGDVGRPVGRRRDHRREGPAADHRQGAIEKVIAEVMAANPAQLADYRSGKDKLFGFLRRPGHEGDRRQGEPGAGERSAAQACCGSGRMMADGRPAAPLPVREPAGPRPPGAARRQLARGDRAPPIPGAVSDGARARRWPRRR